MADMMLLGQSAHTGDAPLFLQHRSVVANPIRGVGVRVGAAVCGGKAFVALQRFSKNQPSPGDTANLAQAALDALGANAAETNAGDDHIELRARKRQIVGGGVSNFDIAPTKLLGESLLRELQQPRRQFRANDTVNVRRARNGPEVRSRVAANLKHACRTKGGHSVSNGVSRGRVSVSPVGRPMFFGHAVVALLPPVSRMMAVELQAAPAECLE